MRLDVRCPHCEADCGALNMGFVENGVEIEEDWYCSTCKTYFDLEVDVEICITPIKKDKS